MVTRLSKYTVVVSSLSSFFCGFSVICLKLARCWARMLACRGSGRMGEKEGKRGGEGEREGKKMKVKKGQRDGGKEG